MSYLGAREDAEKDLYIAVDNARTQNLKESTAGEAAGILCLYYMTSEISAALEAGKDIGFIAKQTKENIQDLAIDTRNLYQELAKDGELSKSDWGFLGKNVAENFFTNLVLGGFGEVVDVLKPSKEINLKKVEKVAEEAENVKKIENVTSAKPNQVHHYATNKNKNYTQQFKDIIKKYGLDLDEEWNKELLPHLGRHPNEYHEFVLEELRNIDNIANGDIDTFNELFESGVKSVVRENPEMLYKSFWNN